MRSNLRPPCWLCALVFQAVKPAKDLQTFLGNSLGHHGPFPPPCRDLDSGWEVRQPQQNSLRPRSHLFSFALLSRSLVLQRKFMDRESGPGESLPHFCCQVLPLPKTNAHMQLLSGESPLEHEYEHAAA